MKPGQEEWCQENMMAGDSEINLNDRHELAAVLPLDDDLLDYLLERSLSLIAECQRLRQELAAGDFVTHEEVIRLATPAGN